jgi:carbon monoxide dehydrogenase subunit G
MGGGAAGAAVTFTQECLIPVGRERLWDFLMDVPAVSGCVPGVGAVEAVSDNVYRGGLEVKVGPIRLALQGTITIEEQDRVGWRARMRAEANDRRLAGGIRARMHLTLLPDEAGTRVRIDTDLAVLGKIGEFGQPIIRSKADKMLEEFARNLGAALAT